MLILTKHNEFARTRLNILLYNKVSLERKLACGFRIYKMFTSRWEVDEQFYKILV